MLKTRIKHLALVACAISLCSCAARQVQAVQMAQPGDETLDCPAIARQIAANNQAIAVFLKEDKQVENGNIAKGVAGAIPYVGILIALSSDLSNVEQVKARSLIDRDEELNYLAKQKGCTK